VLLDRRKHHLTGREGEESSRDEGGHPDHVLVQEERVSTRTLEV
jgi:hypothetical protein